MKPEHSLNECRNRTECILIRADEIEEKFRFDFIHLCLQFRILLQDAWWFVS